MLARSIAWQTNAYKILKKKEIVFLLSPNSMTDQLKTTLLAQIDVTCENVVMCLHKTITIHTFVERKL